MAEGQVRPIRSGERNPNSRSANLVCNLEKIFCDNALTRESDRGAIPEDVGSRPGVAVLSSLSRVPGIVLFGYVTRTKLTRGHTFPGRV